MNLDICKNCKRLFYVLNINNKYELLCFENGKCADTEKCIAYLNESQYYKLINSKSYRIINIFELYELKKFDFINNIKIQNNCPFNIEHELSDWNNKND